ncbi:hypothetical protein K502DRAFT_367305 [Neoconidiobolus thromboides FSU 785]|nr:hypothetical protein K502DRAFT_367305 [Neoconidiobolus thromboides FSU 785]
MMAKSKLEDKEFNVEDERFKIKRYDYTPQYCHYYQARLYALKERVDHVVQQECKQRGLIYCSISNLVDDELCFISGIVFVNLKKRPSIVQEAKEKLWVVEEEKVDYYYSEEDEIYIEDFTSRLQLVNVSIPLITGSVCAVIGKKIHGGKFHVDEVYFPEQLKQKYLLKDIDSSNNNEKQYIGFISGLEIDQNGISNNLMLLKEYLMGFYESDGIAKDIIQLIIAGNTFGDDCNLKKTRLIMNRYFKDLSHSLPIHLMSGEKDISTFISLPQQPLHRSLFYDTDKTKFKTVPNPYNYNVHNLNILGSSGINDEAIQKNSDKFDQIEALNYCLKVHNLFPNAPDTSSTYPFNDVDPFIIDELPHILFTANHPTFETKLIHQNGQKTRLMTIPKFKDNPSLILIEVNTLDYHVINFA